MTIEARNPGGDAAGVATSTTELVALCQATAPPEVAGRRGSAHTLAGPWATPLRGGGIEFEEVRAYQPGDDVRSIDWRVTARTGRPHARVFREDHEQPLWLLVDLGPDMHFGTRRAFKSVVAARAAALLSWWGLRDGDRVGGFVRAPDELRVLPPRSDPASHLALLEAIARGTRVHRGASPVELDDALGRLAEAAHAGSRVFVIADFDALGPAGRRHLAQLARWCELGCVLVYDALEAQAPPPGEYRIHDGSHPRTVSVGGRRARDAYQLVFQSKLESLRQLCRIHRIELVAIRTDEDPAEILPEIVAPRHRGRS